MDYKEEKLQSLISGFLLDNTFLTEQNDFTFDESDEENQEEYFDIDLFLNLETSIERLRYFVLYKLKNIKDLNDIMTKIIIDLKIAIDNDEYVLIKTLIVLFSYKANFIPSFTKIYQILYNSLKNEDLTNDARELIILYYKSYDRIYSQEEIDNLIIFLINNDNKCRTSIFKLLIRLIILNSYCFALEFIINIIDLFPDLNILDKYYVTHIILAMLISINDENHMIVKNIFTNFENQMKDILFICAEGENITAISAILFYIRDYENYDKYEDLMILCKERKEKENLRII